MLQISEGGTRNTFIEIGLRERLLCQECEELFNENYETYFRRLWYEQSALPPSAHDEWLPMKGLDYARFKLFHLSIFWRASAASGPAFAQTALGPHEEVIRCMLLQKEPRDPLTYQVFGTVMTMRPDGFVNHAFLMPPLPFRVEGVRLYAAVYGGCAWEIAFAKHPLSGRYVDRMLKADGSIQLGVDTLENFAPAKNQYRTYAETVRKNGWVFPWQRS